MRRGRRSGRKPLGGPETDMMSTNSERKKGSVKLRHKSSTRRRNCCSGCVLPKIEERPKNRQIHGLLGNHSAIIARPYLVNKSVQENNASVSKYQRGHPSTTTKNYHPRVIQFIRNWSHRVLFVKAGLLTSLPCSRGVVISTNLILSNPYHLMNQLLAPKHRLLLLNPISLKCTYRCIKVPRKSASMIFGRYFV